MAETLNLVIVTRRPTLTFRETRRRISPYFGKRTLLDIPYRMIPPELVGIDSSIPGNAGDAGATRIAAVELQELQYTLRRTLHVEIRPVAVVVNGKNLNRLAHRERLLSLCDYYVKSRLALIG